MGVHCARKKQNDEEKEHKEIINNTVRTVYAKKQISCQQTFQRDTQTEKNMTEGKFCTKS
jgi:hypothetical protein